MFRKLQNNRNKKEEKKMKLQQTEQRENSEAINYRSHKFCGQSLLAFRYDYYIRHCSGRS